MWLLLLLIIGSTTAMTEAQLEEDSAFFRHQENGMYDNFARHPCRRECKPTESMTCYYKLYIGNYQMMGPECKRCLNDTTACEAEHCIYGDGVRMALRLINGQFPGPAIEVCQFDTLVVDIVNNLHEDTTIHWHGIHMAKTPESDGVDSVTQYGIRPGTVYRVCFEVEEDGTEWYHSHMHWQRAEGVWSILIIRASRINNPYAQFYDYDDSKHALLIHDIGDLGVPRNIVINGKGRSRLNSWPDNDPRHRYHRLNVTAGSRNRVRVVFNGVSNCPVEVSIQNHRFLVIATDGNSIEPVYADAVQLTSGERFDLIVYANQTPSAYWIKVTGTIDCTNMTQYAVLQYQGVSNNLLPNSVANANRTIATSKTPRVIVNALTENPSQTQTAGAANETIVITNTNLATLGLKSPKLMPCPPNATYVKVYLSFGLMVTDSKPFLQISNITYLPSNISLLQGRHLYDEQQQYCNRESFRNAGIDCGTVHCQCTHVIKIPAFKCVELIVVNYMPTTHPFHGHGYTYRLVGQGQLAGNLAALRNLNLATLGLKSPKLMPCPPNATYVKVYLSFGLMVTDSKPFLQISNITYLPSNISLLQGRHLYDEQQQYCNRESFRNAGIDCGTVHCQCTHVIKIPAFKCVELIVVNYMPTTHPFHGHGYTYRLVGQGQLAGNLAALRNIEETDRQGGLFRLPSDYPAVEKDTVQVPPEGYIIMRFKSDNPGVWLMHCHIERHSLLGMMAVAQVGEASQFKRITSASNCFGFECGRFY